jgi:hypothetical protein
MTNMSVGRFPDGTDKDSNCNDFLIQHTINLAAPVTAGADNIKVASVADLAAGQKIIIDTGEDSETVIIATVGTAGATTVAAATGSGTAALPVASAAGFSVGQTITIGSGADHETAVIASITTSRRRYGSLSNNPADTITIAMPLKHAHTTGAQVSGSGITLTTPLTRDHDSGVPVADNIPTPGRPNQYILKP